MVKLFQQQFPFDFPWSTTSIGLWLKYPNPHSTHVLTIDVLSRDLDVETGVLRTERLLKCRQGVPKWIMRVLGITEDAYVREVIYVDPASKMTSMISMNLSLSQYMQVVEMISYSPHPDSPEDRTLFSQRAHISSPPQGYGRYEPSTGDGKPLSNSMRRVLNRVGSKLEDSGFERFGQNAASGRTGFNGVLEEVVRLRELRQERQAE